MAYVGLQGFNQTPPEENPFYRPPEETSTLQDSQLRMPNRNLMGGTAANIPSTAAEAGQLQGMGMGGAGGEGAIAGGSTGGGGMLSAGWIGAIAAAIAINEKAAREGGHRSEDNWQYNRDLLKGEVFTQDLSERWFPQMGAGENSVVNKFGTVIGAPLTFDFEKTAERWKALFS